jgi:hypothetical protein
MTGINSAVTGKFTDPPVIMTGITSRFISWPVGTSEPDQQQALLETATAEQVHCLCLCVENVMKRKYLMPKHVMKKLRPYKHGWQIEENVEEEKNGYSFNMVKLSLDYY